MFNCLDDIEPVRLHGIYIYYLLDNSQIVYIGKTRSLSLRMATHVSKSIKIFDSYKIIEVPDKLDPDECEFFQILKYKPIYNKVLPNVNFLTSKKKAIDHCQTAWENGKLPIFNISKPDYVIELHSTNTPRWKTPNFDDKHKLLDDLIDRG